LRNSSEASFALASLPLYFHPEDKAACPLTYLRCRLVLETTVTVDRASSRTERKVVLCLIDERKNCDDEQGRVS
jgi:hypothetical protein